MSARPRSEWGSGDLPAPYAEGDVIDVPEGAACLAGDVPRVTTGPGLYVVSYVTSIGEGDEWYVRLRRVAATDTEQSSDRLHIIHAERATVDDGPSVDWMEGTWLVDTFDPEGLALRRQMLADGWQPPTVERCPTCGRVT